MQKINTFLWFDKEAEEAINFYISIFKNSKMIDEQRYGADAPLPEGTLFVGTFELDGQQFMAMNAGPHFKFTEAISLYVDCEDQAEVDLLWEAFLDNGGEESQCGWLKDRYGLSWQIIPKQLNELMNGSNAEKSARVMQAMLKMVKIDVAELQRAYDGE